MNITRAQLVAALGALVYFDGNDKNYQVGIIEGVSIDDLLDDAVERLNALITTAPEGNPQ